MNHALLDLISETLSVAPSASRLLVCHNNDAVLTGALHGHYTQIWWRTAGPEKPTAWPEAQQFEEILLPLPRGKESLRLCLNACASALKPGGKLWVFGLNDLGIKSADKALQEFFTQVDAAATGGHGRVWKASGLKPVNQALPQLRRTQGIAMLGKDVPMHSYPGLFAGGALDEGTALLLDALPDEVPATVIDYACGIGVIARAALMKNPSAQITVADNDPLALLAATENVSAAIPMLTALPTDLTGTYDLLLSNPPIHQGDVQSFQVVDLLIRELPRLLKHRGAAFIVAQVTVPVARLASMHRLKSEEVAASRSFRVSRLSI